MFPNIPGTTEPSSSEFIHNPQFRQAGSFFLGAVFMTSIRYLALSQVSMNVVRWAWSRILAPCGIQSPIPTVQDRRRSSSSSSNEKSDWSFHPHSSITGMKYQHEDYPLLTFVLNLCVVFASSGHFVSLLFFSIGGIACAFSVAWGSMAAQLTRLTALIILFRYLRSAGMKSLEYACSWGLLLLSLGLAFGNTAVSVGILKPVQISSLADGTTSSSAITLCYRKQFLPTSLATSLVYIVLEVYVLGRFLSFYWATMRKDNTAARHQRLDIWRIVTLLFLELLTVVPSAVFTSILTETILYSLGILLVLFSFNMQIIPSFDVQEEVNPPPVLSQSPKSRSTVFQIAPTSQQRMTLPNHPYSLSFHQSGRFETAEGNQVRRLDSFRSGVSGSTESAIVQAAYRHKVAQPALPPHIMRLPQQAEHPTDMDAPRHGLDLASERSSPSQNGSTPLASQTQEVSTPPTAVDRHLRVMSTLLQIPVVESSPSVVDHRSSASIVYGSDIVRAGSSSSSAMNSRVTPDSIRSSVTTNRTRERRSTIGESCLGRPGGLPSRPNHLSATGTFGQQRSSRGSSIPSNCSHLRSSSYPSVGIRRSRRPTPLKVVPAQPLEGVALYSDEEFYNV